MNGNCDYACITIYIDIITMTVVSIDVNWGLFYCAVARLIDFLCILRTEVLRSFFRPLWASDFSLLVQRNTPKEKTPYMLALGCPAMLESTGGMWNSLALRQSHPQSAPAILCFSASLNGRFKIKDQRRRTKDLRTTNTPSKNPSFRRLGRNPDVLTRWIPA